MTTHRYAFTTRDARHERPQTFRRVGSAESRPRLSSVETIDDFDRDLVTFVVNWAPYGGPPDDELFPRFGITSERLEGRVRDIVADGRARNLSIDDRTLLLRALALVNSGRQATIVGTTKTRRYADSLAGADSRRPRPSARNAGGGPLSSAFSDVLGGVRR